VWEKSSVAAAETLMKYLVKLDVYAMKDSVAQKENHAVSKSNEGGLVGCWREGGMKSAHRSMFSLRRSRGSMRRFGILMVVVCAACASQPTGTQSTPRLVPVAEPSGSAAPTVETVPTSDTKQAQILSITGGRERIPLMRLKIRFQNPTKEMTVVDTLRITWPGGARELRPILYVLPGSTKEQVVLLKGVFLKQETTNLQVTWGRKQPSGVVANGEEQGVSWQLFQRGTEEILEVGIGEKMKATTLQRDKRDCFRSDLFYVNFCDINEVAKKLIQFHPDFPKPERNDLENEGTKGIKK
jgi:hypothetical protein